MNLKVRIKWHKHILTNFFNGIEENLYKKLMREYKSKTDVLMYEVCGLG